MCEIEFFVSVKVLIGYGVHQGRLQVEFVNLGSGGSQELTVELV